MDQLAITAIFFGICMLIYNCLVTGWNFIVIWKFYKEQHWKVSFLEIFYLAFISGSDGFGEKVIRKQYAMWHN